MYSFDKPPNQPKRWDPAHFPPGTVVMVNLNNIPNQVTVDHLVRNGVDSWVIVTKEQPVDSIKPNCVFNIDHVQQILKQGVGLPRVAKALVWSTWDNYPMVPKGYMVITDGSIRERVYKWISDESGTGIPVHSYILPCIVEAIYRALQYKRQILLYKTEHRSLHCARTKDVVKLIAQFAPRMRVKKKLLLLIEQGHYAEVYDIECTYEEAEY